MPAQQYTIVLPMCVPTVLPVCVHCTAVPQEDNEAMLAYFFLWRGLKV